MAGFHWDVAAAALAIGTSPNWGDGTTVSAANSGTDGPTSVSSVAGGTRAYDDDSGAGVWNVHFAVGATSGTNNLIWGSARIASWTPPAYFAFKARFSTFASDRSIARVRGGGVQILRLHRTGSGMLAIRNSANSTVATGTVAMPDSTDVRIEIKAVPGAAATCEVRWYLGDSATPSDTIIGTDNFSTQTVVDELAIGNIAAGSNISDYWIWQVRGSDTGWLGPLVTAFDLEDDARPEPPILGTAPTTSARGFAATTRIAEPILGTAPTVSSLGRLDSARGWSILPGGSPVGSVAGRVETARGTSPSVGTAPIFSGAGKADAARVAGPILGSASVRSSLGIGADVRSGGPLTGVVSASSVHALVSNARGSVATLPGARILSAMSAATAIRSSGLLAGLGSITSARSLGSNVVSAGLLPGIGGVGSVPGLGAIVRHDSPLASTVAVVSSLTSGLLDAVRPETTILGTTVVRSALGQASAARSVSPVMGASPAASGCGLAGVIRSGGPLLAPARVGSIAGISSSVISLAPLTGGTAVSVVLVADLIASIRSVAPLLGFGAVESDLRAPELPEPTGEPILVVTGSRPITAYLSGPAVSSVGVRPINTTVGQEAIR